MNNRINYERVRKIKNVIYTLIILLFLVPAILLIVLGIQMMNYLEPIRTIIAQHESAQAATPPPAAIAPTPVQQIEQPAQAPPEQFPVPPALEPDAPELLDPIAALPDEYGGENGEVAGQASADRQPAAGGGAPGTATGMPVEVGIPRTGLPG